MELRYLTEVDSIAFEQPRLPRAELLHDPVGDSADEVGTHLDLHWAMPGPNGLFAPTVSAIGLVRRRPFSGFVQQYAVSFAACEHEGSLVDPTLIPGLDTVHGPDR